MSHRHSHHSSRGPGIDAGNAASGRDSHPTSAHDPGEAAHHEMSSEHRPGLLPELYFRWRGGEITRLEAFCDVCSASR